MKLCVLVSSYPEDQEAVDVGGERKWACYVSLPHPSLQTERVLIDGRGLWAANPILTFI